MQRGFSVRGSFLLELEKWERFIDGGGGHTSGGGNSTIAREWKMHPENVTLAGEGKEGTWEPRKASDSQASRCLSWGSEEALGAMRRVAVAQ